MYVYSLGAPLPLKKALILVRASLSLLLIVVRQDGGY